MAVKLRKPILVGGIGLSIVLWLWDSFHKSVTEVGELTVLGAIAVGMLLWLLQQYSGKDRFAALNLSPLKREEVESAIAEVETMLTYLETEAPDRDFTAFKEEIAQLPQQLTRQELQLVITGGRSVGKSKLKEVLAQGELNLIETEALFTGLENRDQIATETALAADLVLFVTNGDLTDSEWQFLQQLRSSRQRVLLLFNKQDQYVPEERAVILQQLKQRVKTIIAESEVMAIAADPSSVKVRQHQEDGSVQEWREQPEAELSLLGDRLPTILKQEQEQLVWATTWRKAVNLKGKAKEILNEIRRDRALPLIEQYQWIAAATAFTNPVTALDLLATAAINAQMLVDLGNIYQQQFSLAQAQTAAATIGKLMVQLGVVELSTQTIGSLLKSNAVTYVAGGAVQGVSAAYLTRLAGLSLIAYFQEQELSANSSTGLNFDSLGNKLKDLFQQNQRNVFLQGFVKQAIGRLTTEAVKLETVAS